MNAKSGLVSALTGLCPQCRSKSMFVHGTYHAKFLKMNKTCSNCGLQYEREPGFFYGAMYVSYALSVGILLVTGTLVFFVGNDPDLWVYIVSVTSVSILLYPLNFRLSRSLFLHLFSGMKFRPEKVK